MRLYVHWTVCPWPRALDWGLVVQDVLSHMEARWLWWSVGAEGQQDDGGDWAMCLSLPRRLAQEQVHLLVSIHRLVSSLYKELLCVC